jgi:formylglycine-generating enzyme required for sulfatase activity
VPIRVFVSHASVDSEIALRICNGLESRGLVCWIAPRDVQSRVGTWGPEIDIGISASDVFLLVLTEAAAKSPHVEREAVLASESDKWIIPLEIDNAKPGRNLRYYLAGRQRIRLSTAIDDSFLDKLGDIVRGERVAHVPQDRPTSGRPMWLLPALAVGLALVIAVSYFTTRPEPSSTSNTNLLPPAQNVPSKPAVETPSPRPSDTKKVSARSNSSSDAATKPAPSATTPPPTATASAPATVSGVRLSFVSIPGGTFRMGCSATDADCQDDEKPARQVVVDPFQISATEVTQEFWEAVMGSNPSDFKGPSRPVENVSWQDAQNFLERLNDRQDGFTYRLPHESEWEYAARANQANPLDLTAIAWFEMAGGAAGSPRPQRVATKRANPWGLYDMLGNVAEWCEDWYSPNYQRVTRGGSWLDSSRSVRVSARGKAVPTTRDYSIGVRLVRITP